MQRLQPGPDGADYLERLRTGEPVDLQAVRERALVGVGHDEVGPAVVELAGDVHADDVGGLDLAQVAALLDEAAADLRVLGPVLGQHLHRDR